MDLPILHHALLPLCLLATLLTPPILIPAFCLFQTVLPNSFPLIYWSISFLLKMTAIHIYSIQKAYFLAFFSFCLIRKEGFNFNIVKLCTIKAVLKLLRTTVIISSFFALGKYQRKYSSIYLTFVNPKFCHFIITRKNYKFN